MFNFTYSLVVFVMNNDSIIPAALVVAAGNLLVQNFINLVFGSKGLPKLRGYRGE